VAKILSRKILPFIGHRTLNVTDEALSVSMNNFYALNYLLAIHFFHYPDLGSASDWLRKIPSRHNQSEALPRSG